MAALKHISNKKYIIKNTFHAFTPKATSLYNDLKTVGYIIYRVKRLFSNNIPLPHNLQNLIDLINTKHDFSISSFPNSRENLATWISNTKIF